MIVLSSAGKSALGSEIYSSNCAYLGLPNQLVHKVPSDGLSGMSDEDKLGFKYAQLDEYISDPNADLPAELKTIIDKMHVANLHKLQVMPAYKRH